jgi:hypothetical protein
VIFLTSLSGEVLLLGVVLVVLVMSVGVAVLLGRRPEGRRDRAATTAAAYMTALGSLFAIVTGFLINSEYATLRSAQQVVATEAAGISQLAYASAALPPPDAEIVQGELADYVDSVATVEWYLLSENQPQASPAFAQLAVLQEALVRVSTREYPSAEAVASMSDALRTMTQMRRERIAIAAQGLPIALFALSVNAVVVAARFGSRYVVIAAGIILMVALGLAAILAISAPFRGPFTASPEPLRELAVELRNADYLPWVR